MANLARKNVLFIDDDEINNFVIQTKMEHSAPGVEAEFCYSARDAFNYLDSEISAGRFPNIIFLDVKMPEMDGFDFLEEYHSRGWHDSFSAKIFMVSSSITENDRNKSLKYSAVEEFINKPLNVRKIDNIVHFYF